MELANSKPIITRHKLSIYEYAGMLTQLAEYFMNIKDLDRYIETPQVNNIIDPCSLAFKLLIEGKIDIQIERLGYETVLFSQCERDEMIEKEITNYLNSREKDRKETLTDKLFNNTL